MVLSLNQYTQNSDYPQTFINRDLSAFMLIYQKVISTYFFSQSNSFRFTIIKYFFQASNSFLILNLTNFKPGGRFQLGKVVIELRFQNH